MKKIVSILASISMIFALTTTSFAYLPTDAVVGGAGSLSGTTITYDLDSAEEGFTFSIQIKSNAVWGLVYRVDMSALEAKGWTFEKEKHTNASGHEMTGGVYNTDIASTEEDPLALSGQNAFTITAIPPSKTAAVIDDLTFDVILRQCDCDDVSAAANTTTTYKLVSTGGTVVTKPTASTDANGVTTVTNTDGFLNGKKIRLDTTLASGSISATSKIKVTYDNGTPRYFDGLLEALGVSDTTVLEVGTIQFGVVYDDNDGIEDATKFAFELINE